MVAIFAASLRPLLLMLCCNQRGWQLTQFVLCYFLPIPNVLMKKVHVRLHAYLAAKKE